MSTAVGSEVKRSRSQTEEGGELLLLQFRRLRDRRVKRKTFVRSLRRSPEEKYHVCTETTVWRRLGPSGHRRAQIQYKQQRGDQITIIITITIVIIIVIVIVVCAAEAGHNKCDVIVWASGRAAQKHLETHRLSTDRSIDQVSGFDLRSDLIISNNLNQRRSIRKKKERNTGRKCFYCWYEHNNEGRPRAPLAPVFSYRVLVISSW